MCRQNVCTPGCVTVTVAVVVTALASTPCAHSSDPLTEKETPEWLSAVWGAASSCLSTCERWIVCGYSLPAYDIGLQELFGQSSTTAMEICLVDPCAALLTETWQQVAPGARIFNFDGLPQGLRALDEHLCSDV
jgi:hypothetical protein